MESKYIEILAKVTELPVNYIKSRQYVGIADALSAMSELTASHQAELKAKDEQIARLKDFIVEASRHIEFCQCDDPTHGDPLYCKRCNRLFELID